MFFVQYNAQKTYFLHNSEDEITLNLRKGRSNMAITERVEKIRQNYVNTKPHISYERAWSWTKSFQRTEGLPNIIRVAQAFKDTCSELSVNIWEGELVVGTSGEYRKCAILTPEFGWLWINDEIDTFPERGQDPYEVTPEHSREHFPLLEGQVH